MKFFTKYSLISNVASILIVTAGVLYIGDRALDGGSDPKNFHPGESVELTAYNFHYNGYDEKGKLSTYFIAQKLEQYVNQNLKMTNIIEKNYDAETQKITWQFKAHHAKTQKITTGDLIHLYDGVNSIVYTKGNSSNSSKENTSSEKAPKKIHIISSEMYYNTETKDFYTSKFVRMYDPANGNNTTGDGVFGNSETKKINLNNNVRSYYAFS